MSPLVTQSGHQDRDEWYPLSGVKRTLAKAEIGQRLLAHAFRPEPILAPFQLGTTETNERLYCSKFYELAQFSQSATTNRSK